MRKKFIPIVCVYVLFICGCATMFIDQKIMQAEQKGQLRVGMEWGEVYQIVGRGINQFSDNYRTETDSAGTHEIWEINGRSRNLNFSRTYYFKFLKKSGEDFGYLESWGSY